MKCSSVKIYSQLFSLHLDEIPLNLSLQVKMTYNGATMVTFVVLRNRGGLGLWRLCQIHNNNNNTFYKSNMTDFDVYVNYCLLD